MTGDNTHEADDLVAETVETFQSFGFTEYEAKCFVALARIESGTAKEVSDVSGVPRARVYDCMDGLADRGVVDVENASPRRFRAADTGDVVDVLRRGYDRRLDSLEEYLGRLEPPGETDDDGSVWMTEGDEEVSERAESLIRSAEDELLLAVAVEGLLTGDVEDALVDASERGVAITAGSPSEEIRSELRDLLPEATVLETWTWWESHPIKPGAISAIVMADGRSLLVSADVETTLPGVRKHRALWTDSGTTPLVGMMRPLLQNAITSGPGPEAPA
ncbi:MAG: TrmB family transcriptional regulator [Halobacteriales archaeon]